MKATICGMGWVTPLGRDLDGVYQAILAGAVPEPSVQSHPSGGNDFPVLRVPESCLADTMAFPRLRRSSSISHFAVAAAVDAAGSLDAAQRARTALIFAASDGGVVYTRRFYGDIVERGPGAGSPLLFPETVYNAPASHIAARLGLEGEALTMVGDVEVTFDAVQAAIELLEIGSVDYCLVVAAQEIDWIICEAYCRWGLSAPASSTQAIFSEGGAAILLGRGSDGVSVQSVLTGNGRSGNPLDSLPELHPSPGSIVCSASGTRPGAGEESTLRQGFPLARIFQPKRSLGEAMACSSLQQVIFAALNLQNSENRSSLAFATGFNQRISALFLTAKGTRA